MTQAPHSFNYVSLPNHVRFGCGRVNEVNAILQDAGANRVLVLSTGRTDLAEQIGRQIEKRLIGIHNQAVQHVPAETVQAAVDLCRQKEVDFLIAPGGGSTIGLAKGIALELGLPILAVPTTYAGSEMTHIWGISENGVKTTGRAPIVKPKWVIYDPELITTLPPSISLTSGINAMAHAVEALYAENRNPIANMMAEEGVRRLASSLPHVVSDPSDIEARTRSLYGAWLAASVLDMVGMALHHKLCHTLGGSFKMPHAPTHTVILPYAIAYNHSHTSEAMAALARALRVAVDDVAGSVQDISRHSGGPVSLRELGFRIEDIPKAADLALQKRYFNPKPITRSGLEQLLTQAFHGKRPTVID